MVSSFPTAAWKLGYLQEGWPWCRRLAGRGGGPLCHPTFHGCAFVLSIEELVQGAVTILSKHTTKDSTGAFSDEGES